MSDTIEDLVHQVDAARNARDTDELERVEAKIREWTKVHGKRNITGKLDMTIPEIGWNLNLKGAEEGFDQWNQGSN